MAFSALDYFVLVLIVFAVLIHYGRNFLEQKTVYILSELLIVGCTLWSVFIAIIGVEHPLLFKIDHLFNGRFQWAKSEGGIQYWSLFSNEMNQNYSDNNKQENKTKNAQQDNQKNKNCRNSSSDYSSSEKNSNKN